MNLDLALLLKRANLLYDAVLQPGDDIAAAAALFDRLFLTPGDYGAQGAINLVNPGACIHALPGTVNWSYETASGQAVWMKDAIQELVGVDILVEVAADVLRMESDAAMIDRVSLTATDGGRALVSDVDDTTVGGVLVRDSYFQANDNNAIELQANSGGDGFNDWTFKGVTAKALKTSGTYAALRLLGDDTCPVGCFVRIRIEGGYYFSYAASAIYADNPAGTVEIIRQLYIGGGVWLGSNVASGNVPGYNIADAQYCLLGDRMIDRKTGTGAEGTIAGTGNVASAAVTDRVS